MTVEHLSEASATRNNKRMHHDVRTSAKLANPPRIPPPSFARESLDNASSEQDDKPATESAGNAVVRDVEAFLQAFYKVERHLQWYLNEEDAERLCNAVPKPPSNKLELSDPHVVVAGIAVATCLLLYPAMGQRHFRGAAPRAHSNIQSLLRTFTR